MVPNWFAKAWLIALLTISGTLFTMDCVDPLVHAESNQLNILYISSYHKGIWGQKDFESGLDKSLEFTKRHHHLFFEFMGIPFLREEPVRDTLSPYLEKKYADIQFNFIIVWGLRASRFLKSNSNLFPNAHRVYVESGEKRADKAEGPYPKQTIIEFENDFSGSLQEAFRLMDPSRCFVIGTNEDLPSQSRMTAFKNALTDAAPKQQAEYILNQTVEQVGLKLESVPEKDAIAFYLLMYFQKPGEAVSPGGILNKVASRSAVPIFTFWENLVGEGAVGGYVFSHEKIGFHLGETILSISKGEAVKEFSPMRYVYDWREVKKWGIDENRLPTDAIILNRPPNILIQYRWHLAAAGVAFIALSVFSFFLPWALRHRNIALNELDIERKTLEIKVDERTGDLLKTNKILTEEIEARKQTELEKEQVIHELEEAIEEIKSLKGILPLCSFCKKIRDDKGYWEQVDVYIHKHSEADISHSVCPECFKKNYPEEYASISSAKSIGPPDSS